MSHNNTTNSRQSRSTVLATCPTPLWALDPPHTTHFPSDTDAFDSREVRIFQTGRHTFSFSRMVSSKSQKKWFHLTNVGSPTTPHIRWPRHGPVSSRPRVWGPRMAASCDQSAQHGHGDTMKSWNLSLWFTGMSSSSPVSTGQPANAALLFMKRNLLPNTVLLWELSEVMRVSLLAQSLPRRTEAELSAAEGCARQREQHVRRHEGEAEGPENKGALVCSGCRSTGAQIVWLQQERRWSLTVLEAPRPGASCQQGSFERQQTLSMLLSLGCRGLSSPLVFKPPSL